MQTTKKYFIVFLPYFIIWSASAVINYTALYCNINIDTLLLNIVIFKIFTNNDNII